MENPLLEAPVPGQVPRWQLSAPESYVLLRGPHASGAEAFKKGLLELAARGMLKLERRTRNRFLWFTATHSILLPGSKMATIHAAPAPLRAIHSLYLSTRCFSSGRPGQGPASRQRAVDHQELRESRSDANPRRARAIPVRRRLPFRHRSQEGLHRDASRHGRTSGAESSDANGRA